MSDQKEEKNREAEVPSVSLRMKSLLNEMGIDSSKFTSNFDKKEPETESRGLPISFISNQEERPPNRTRDIFSFNSISSLLLSPPANEREKLWNHNNNDSFISPTLKFHFNQALSTAVSFEGMEHLPFSKAHDKVKELEIVDEDSGLESRIFKYLDELNLVLTDPGEKRFEFNRKLKKKSPEVQRVNSEGMENAVGTSKKETEEEGVCFSMNFIKNESSLEIFSGHRTCPFSGADEPDSFSLFLHKNKLRNKLVKRKQKRGASIELVKQERLRETV